MLSKLVKIAAVLVALTFLPALAGTSTVVAQESGEKSKARQVEELANKGAQAYGQQRYRDAIGFFEKAYALQPVPNLLYNIGRCHEKLEEYEKAIEYYEEFAVAPQVGSQARRDALDRAESLREIANIKTAGPSNPSQRAKNGTQGSGTDDAEESGSSVPWIVTGTGAGVLAAGAVFGVLASGSADEIQTGADFQARKDAQSRARTQALVADSLFVAGAVTTGIGVYLLLSSDSGESTDKTNALVLPYANDSGAGVGVRLDF